VVLWAIAPAQPDVTESRNGTKRGQEEYRRLSPAWGVRQATVDADRSVESSSGQVFLSGPDGHYQLSRLQFGLIRRRHGPPRHPTEPLGALGQRDRALRFAE